MKKVFQILFRPNKPYVLSTHWPWWEFTLLRHKTIRMMVKAEDEHSAKEEVYKAHVPLHEKDFIDINIFLCVEKPDHFNPFNDTFPKREEMKWEEI